ncbi:MAG: recombinase family protein [Chloroflexota bacterium]|nr:recombinase family protein [Chloroflexota bacterium]
MTPIQRTPMRQTARITTPDTAALYLRVSSDEQVDDGFGLDVQRQQTTAYAAAFGLQVVATFADEGISGTKEIVDRPGLQSAIDEAKRGDFSTLIVPAIDRLARRAGLLLSIWDELEAAGVVIVAVKERIDTSTPAGRLMRTMFAGVAEFERDSIVARTTDGRNMRGMKDGERGGRVPYGYLRRDGEILVDVRGGAPVVKRIFGWQRRGWSLHQIAKQLNEDGSRTPQGAEVWYPTTVRIILRNRPMYAGGQRGDSPVCWPAIL